MSSWIFTVCLRACVAGVESKPNIEWQDLTVRLVRGQVMVERQVTIEADAALTWRDLWTRHGHEWIVSETREKENVSSTVHSR